MDEIRAEVDRRAAIIGAAPDDLPTYGDSDGDGRPHLEVRGQSLSWVVQERGTEHERRTTTDLGELLYWTFDAVTDSMASRWEVQHRIPYAGPRIIQYAWQLALLGRLDPAWRERRLREQIRILAEKPPKPRPLGASELRDLRSFLVRAPQGLSAKETVMLDRISATLAADRELTATQRAFMVAGLAARGLEVNGLSYRDARDLMEHSATGLDRFDPDVR